MPWKTFHFEEIANEEGNFAVQQSFDVPIRVTILRFKVETSSSCLDREHLTTAQINSNTFLENVPIKDCKPYKHSERITVGPGSIDVKMISGGFTPGEKVKGKAHVKVSLFSLAEDRSRALSYTGIIKKSVLGLAPNDKELLESPWVPLPTVEEHFRNQLRSEIAGREQHKDSWNKKGRCLGVRLKHYHWKNEYTDVSPNYDSVSIKLNRDVAHAVGEVTIDAYSNAHHVLWDCGIRKGEARAQANATVDLTINVDLTSGQPQVDISYYLTIGKVEVSGGRVLSGLVKLLLFPTLEVRITEMIPEMERLIEEKIRDAMSPGLTINDQSPREVHSFIEAVGLQRIIDEEDLYEDIIDELSLACIKAPSRDMVQVFQLQGEINRELLVRLINGKTFSFNPQRIEDERNGIWFDDIDIKLQFDVDVDSVRVILAPAIKIILDMAMVKIDMSCSTNILEDGKLDINGKVMISLSHTYGEDIIDFRDLEFESLEVSQLPGWSEIIRNLLNDHLPDKIRDDHKALREIAAVINLGIDDALDTEPSFQFMSHSMFARECLSNVLDENLAPYCRTCGS